MGLRKLTGQKTYWHLLDLKRQPSVYEIVSSRLHYYPHLGFSIDTPIQTWYQQYQSGSAFQSVDLEAFSDPRKTTYSSYTQLQNERETSVNDLLDNASSAADAALPSAWLQTLAQVFAPVRYPCHALMMIAAYLSSIAPGSRVTIVAAFQAADELRRVHGLARRLHQLRQTHPELGDDAKQIWLEHSAWQELRRIIEKTLVIYDWSECFVTLNLALKPTFDQLFGHALATCAGDHGDDTSAQLLNSLEQDTRWHSAWSQQLLRTVFQQSPRCHDTVLARLNRYIPELDEAISALAYLIDPNGQAAQCVAQTRSSYLADCGLEIELR